MTLPFVAKQKHKLFLSFYHYDDDKYRDAFARTYRQDYVSKSVEPGDIDTQLSTEYIKRLIRENYIADASVVLALVGPNTRFRKHVDWEISAGLEPSSGRSGLIAVLLPEFPLDSRGNYNPNNLPPRLNDNLSTGYAEAWRWDRLIHNRDRLIEVVDDAFARRLTHESAARNGREQMHRNTGPAGSSP